MMFNGKATENNIKKKRRNANFQNSDTVIEKFFNKKFWIQVDHNLNELDYEKLFTEDRWSSRQLQILKSRLNFHKSQLNDFPIELWSKHTRQQNPAGEVVWRVRQSINPEFLTQAWTKFYEILHTYNIVSTVVKGANKLVSLHLCEAPGAFVASLNHYLKCNFPDIEWRWLSTTLNPYYEGNSLSNMITDDRFMFHTLQNWCFGKDGTGNIMDWENSQDLIKKAKDLGEVLLVTADGSIDCLEQPDEQEEVVSPLHYCEVVTALQALSKGGVFIWKLFTVFEDCTINMLYLIFNLFEDVQMFKPCTSKEGNSEVYLVCLGFKGCLSDINFLERIKIGYGTPLYHSKSIFPKHLIPDDFVHHIVECASYFTNLQCSIIDNNIVTYTTNSRFNNQTKQLRALVANEFIRRYELKSISFEEEILKGLMHQEISININPRRHVGSYTKRVSYLNMTEKEKIAELSEELRNLSKIFNYVSDTKDLKFTIFYNESLDLSMEYFTGQPINNLKSSQFIFLPLLRFYKKLRNEYEHYDWVDSLSIIKSCLLYTLKECKCNFLSFNNWDESVSYETWEKEGFTLIFQKLKDLSHFDTLVLVNFNLLSHFNVGILLLLSCKCFESIEFFNGEAVILRNIRSKQETLNIFASISKEIEYQKSQGNAVLRILPVERTNNGDLYNKVLVYNNSMYRQKSLLTIKYIRLEYEG